ncbi:LysM peptidoglycan-binding domain-containing protein [Cellulosimicrobium terreum]|nr:LysM peptidoglycan-binding domain-containing protein [Cellulosimicrobium terreum]
MSTIAAGATRPGSAGERPVDAPLRLTTRGRLVLVLLTAVLLVLAARVGGAVAGGVGEPEEVRVHVVQAGETFWAYAQDVAGPGDDVRDVVHRLRELNGAGSSELQVGQRVVLPVSHG